jgi:hypothetical protein
MQMEISRRYHFTPARLARLKKGDNLLDMCRRIKSPMNFHVPLEGNII